MQNVALKQESLRLGGFHVPQFEIRIEGVGLPRDVLRDVTQLSYKDSIKAIDSIELMMNNWDPASGTFKYIGSETKQSLQGRTPESLRYHLFEPNRNREFQVWMGYMGDLRLMMRGNFKTMAADFSTSGPPVLRITGLNILDQLRTKQYSGAWSQKKDSDIALEIGALKRFPLRVVVDDNAKDQEKPIEHVAQHNQYDIDFLHDRARQRGYVLFVMEGEPTATGEKRERRLYFGPPSYQVTYELKWGLSLVDFKPTLVTATQFKSVTVKGWNRSTRQAIEEKVDLDDPQVNINRDLFPILRQSDARDEVVVNEPVFTAAQAKQRARAILKDRLKELITASVTCVGLPDLRAGQCVRIEGVGARLSGVYFITDSTHTINDSGYLTRFNARREQKGG